MEQNDVRKSVWKLNIWIIVTSIIFVAVFVGICIFGGRSDRGPFMAVVAAPLMYVSSIFALCVYIREFCKLWKYGKLNISRILLYVWVCFLAICVCYDFYDRLIKGFEFWKELIINHVNIFAQ